MLDDSAAVVPPVARIRRPEKKQGTGKRILLTLLIVIIVFGGSIWFVLKTSGATITLTPKQEQTAVNATFTASQNGGDITFQTESITKAGQLVVPGTTQVESDTKASGTITIYNTSSVSQSLIATTRFATPSGLIFRISKGVTVPAQKGSTPGSIDAVITADKAGSDYNVGLTDFTIPGFKGEAKYTKFYARSKTSIDGGSSGIQPAIDSLAKASAEQKIQDQLAKALSTEAAKDVPGGFVMPLNAYTIKYDPLTSVASSTSIVLSEQATLLGYMFNESQLVQSIMQQAGISDLGNDVTIPYPDNLVFTPAPVATDASSTITFTLEGTTTLVAHVDADTLKQQLAGMPRKSLVAILSNYPGIIKAQAVVEPFWRSTFPADTGKISIIVTTPATVQ